MDDAPRDSRRAFLLGAAVLGPVALGAVSIADGQEKPVKNDLLASDPGPDRPATSDYRPGFFSEAEWAFVRAACDRLVPRDEVGPGALELGAPEYIDRQLQSGYGAGERWYMSGPFVKADPEFGYQSKLTPREQYRLGIRAIDDFCRAKFGHVFFDIGPARQDQLLKQLENGEIKNETINLKTFFTSFLLKNTMEGYFCDPMHGGNRGMGSWKMIGYPGVRADYLEFVDIADRRYPYGPVSLHGQRA
ncbi:MAG: gluconate 2-dehydrogenase subunit 3 family protein [Janthinobacterium lividum]